VDVLLQGSTGGSACGGNGGGGRELTMRPRRLLSLYIHHSSIYQKINLTGDKNLNLLTNPFKPVRNRIAGLHA
jgi:molybdenum-dependent DNA-binding transcriptional regulator ModE